MSEKIEPLTPLIDLRPYTRDSDTCFTRITVTDNRFHRHVWILGGQVSIYPHDGGGGYAFLKMYLAKEGMRVVDSEYDSAYALYLNVIGLTLHNVDHHNMTLRGWINPNRPDDFHVPRDVEKMLDVAEFVEKDEHMDEDVYKIDRMTPEPDLKLFKKLRGLRLMIEIGTPPTEYDPVKIALDGPYPGD